jgi:PAS domain S-box-containing protein
MPEMDGYQLCREIKNDDEFKCIPVILLTALSDPRDVVSGLECGADIFITKPYEEKYILSRIQYILANTHLKDIENTQLGVEIFLAGKKYFIKSDRIQILNLLLSSYEVAIQKNDELIKAQDELVVFNVQLEQTVEARTAELRESEGRYRLLLESVTDYIYTTLVEDDRPVATSHGPGCVAVTGYAAEEYSDDPDLWLRMVPEDDRAAVLEQANAVLAGKSVSSLEHRIINKDGRVCWIRNTPVPRHNQKGRLIAFDGIVADITKRKQTEEELSKAKDEWERTFDAIVDPVMILDTDYRIVNVNKVLAGKLELTPSETQGLSCYRVIHQTLEPPEFCPCTRVMADGQPHTAEFHSPSLGGYFSSSVSPLFGPEGKLRGSICIARDINERKRAEQKTLRLNRIYTVLSKFNEAIVRIREPERLLKELCRIVVEYGSFRMAWMGIVDQETLAVKPVVHFGHEVGYLEKIHISLDLELPEGRGPTGTSLRDRRVIVNNDTANNPSMSPWRDEAIQRGYLSSATFPIISTDTLFGAFTIYAGEANYFDEDELRLLISLCDDLSFAIEFMKNEAERKLADDALKKEKGFLRSLLQGSAIATFVLDPQHRVLLWNHACEKLTGVKSADVIGTSQHWRAFYTFERPCLADIIIEGRTENLQQHYAHASRSTLTPEGLQAEGHYPDMNGAGRYILLNSAPIRNGDGALLGAIETIQDISEQKTVEAQLYQAQKMEAIGQLAGGIAHDFNNILTVIIGFSTLIDMGMDKDDPQKANLSNILAAADMAAYLTRSLLTFSRKQDINLHPVDLNQIIRTTDKFLKRIIGEDIELRTTFGHDMVTVNVDNGQIEQVLMNLATNARDAMPNGGLLSIETGTVEVDDDYIKAHGCGEPGWYASVSISDSGEGMDEATRKKVFEPFFTTKEVGKGTGLGLSIVFGIIKQHNGLINVYSEPEIGTTFRILLPLIQSTVAEKQIHLEEMIENGVGTILVADDDASIRVLVEKTLTMFGYTVITAMDGNDALVKFKENKDRIDLVVMDIIMPEINGKDAFNEMRKIDPALKVVFISGYTSDIIRKRGLFEQGLEFVEKPLNLKQLLSKVRDVLREDTL